LTDERRQIGKCSHWKMAELPVFKVPNRLKGDLRVCPKTSSHIDN
jgi:hypothetical protein